MHRINGILGYFGLSGNGFSKINKSRDLCTATYRETLTSSGLQFEVAY